jgi:hypothetical protein
MEVCCGERLIGKNYCRKNMVVTQEVSVITLSPGHMG